MNIIEVLAWVFVLFFPSYFFILETKLSDNQKTQLASMFNIITYFVIIIGLMGVFNVFPRYDMNHISSIALYWGLIFLIFYNIQYRLGTPDNFDAILIALYLVFAMTELWELPIHLGNLFTGDLNQILLTLTLSIPHFFALYPLYIAMGRSYQGRSQFFKGLLGFTVVYVIGVRYIMVDTLLAYVMKQNGVLARGIYSMGTLFIFERMSK